MYYTDTVICVTILTSRRREKALQADVGNVTYLTSLTIYSSSCRVITA